MICGLRVLAFVALAALAGCEVRADYESQKKATLAPRGATQFLIRGAHANAWNAAVVGINGKSTSLDTQWAQFCSAFGNTSAAATVTVEFSADDTNYYSSSVNTGAVTGNFGVNFQIGARYVRLSSSAAATITATLQCKSS